MSAVKHLVFVINPKSGTNRTKEIEHLLQAGLDASRYTYELQPTRHAGHGIEIAREAARKGAFAVAAVGGDGSVNDVATGLQGSDTALAIVPKGSGNGLARTLSIPLNEQKAIEVINRGNSIAMDMGFANGQPFASNAGVGFDALVAHHFTEAPRRGFVGYALLVAKHLWQYHAPQWQLIIDGKPVQDQAFMINVANGQQFGYNFKIAPNASWTDGWLDVIVIRKFPKLTGGASLILRAMQGSILKSPYVRHYRVKEVQLSHPGLQWMQTDGDSHACGGVVDIRIVPGALRVLVP